MNNRIIITGAPGTGKTTLIDALSNANHPIKEEAARFIIDKNINLNDILPWGNREAFDSMVFVKMISDYFDFDHYNMIFYDGGIPDIVAYEQYLGTNSKPYEKLIPKFPYNSMVFILEPWEDIYLTNNKRPWLFSETQLLHSLITKLYETLGYQVTLIKANTTVERRLNDMLKILRE